jgi:hypothetical protein
MTALKDSSVKILSYIFHMLKFGGSIVLNKEVETFLLKQNFYSNGDYLPLKEVESHRENQLPGCYQVHIVL